MNKKAYILSVFLSLLSISVFAQVNAEIIRPSVNASQFDYAGNHGVSSSDQPKTDNDNPKNVVKANVGLSWIVSELETSRRIYNSKPGLGVGIDYQHLWKNGMGIGVNYLYYQTSFKHGYFEDFDVRMHYIGPSFAARRILGKKWLIESSIGLGLSSYIESYNMLDGHYYNDLESEFSVGFFVQLGIEYMISRSIGIGLQGDGLIMPMKKPENYKGKDYDIYGIKRLGAKLGIRFYL